MPFRIKSSHCLFAAAVVVLLHGIFLPAQDTSPDATLTAKAQTLKDQYDRASPADKKEVGENLIDAQLAVANALVAQKDFTGAQKILSQALVTAANIKSDKSQNVTALLTSVSVRKTIAAKIESLRGILIHKPNDPDTTRQLVDLLVLEFGDFKNAQEAAAGQDDAKYKKSLQLADKPLAKLAPQEALDLAAWYLDAAKRNTGTTKTAAQAKAATILKQLLERDKLDDALKGKAQPLFNALPAEAKAQSTDAAASSSQDAPAIGLSPLTIANWLKNVPKDVSERKPGEQNYLRFQRTRDYIRKTYANDVNKNLRVRGPVNERVTFRKSDNGWEAEFSLDLETPSGPIKLRTNVRAAVTQAQMTKLADINRPTVEIDGKWSGIYLYTHNSDGDIATYSIQLQDAKLVSFK